MSQDSRLVRDLLDANLALTQQIVELARLAIGAPLGLDPERAPMPDAGTELPPSEFQLTTSDDWDDIPEQPMGEVRTLEVARRGLPLHVPEEEEDMRHAVALGIAPKSELSALLERYALPGNEIHFDSL